jgi:hypothetical protein
VIAVVGSPVGRIVAGSVVAAGLPMAVARAAAADGAAVQLIGKVGDGSAGDAILLNLAGDGIGHVALLRDPSSAAIERDPATDDLGAESIDALADREVAGEPTEEAGMMTGPDLDAGDLELGLRYLPEYAVIVVAQDLEAAALAAVSEAARWAGARLVIIRGPGATSQPAPDDATVLEAPPQDAEGAFASLVGRYAAALDRGIEPGDAFVAASAAVGWQPAAAD